MAMMGLFEPVWRLPMTPPSEESRKKIEAVLEELRTARYACKLKSNRCSRRSPRVIPKKHFALFARFKQALNEGAIRSAEPDPSSRKRVARECVGQERRADRISHGRCGRHVDRLGAAALFR